jgi:hypothetical protein
MRKGTAAKVIWRYMTGHHLDGHKRTDATWFRDGTFPPRQVNWWTGKRRVYRMLWRHLPVGIVFAGTWLWFVHPVILITFLASAGPFILRDWWRNIRRMGVRRIKPAKTGPGYMQEPEPLGYDDPNIRAELDTIGEVVEHESPY